MKILMTGGTGFIGQQLCQSLADEHDLIVLTRSRNKAQKLLGPKVVCIETLDELVVEKVHPHAIINLAGKNLAEQRWTPEVQSEIYHSRIDLTEELVRFIRHCTVKPNVLISGSAIGYYGDTGDKVIKEGEPAGDDFAANLCKDWERQAYKARDYDVRVVSLRTSLVLGIGGALDKMLLPYKLNLGGPIASGKQYMSWIHQQDMVRLIKFCLENESIEGPVNASSPVPVTNKQFAKRLAKTLKRIAILPMPAFMLKLVAGDMAEMLITGQRVIPDKAVKAGFEFNFPELNSALEDILN
jgi:uncharacterized protein